MLLLVAFLDFIITGDLYLLILSLWVLMYITLMIVLMSTSYTLLCECPSFGLISIVCCLSVTEI